MNPPAAAAQGRLDRILLLAAACLCGAAVMVTEVLGARIVGPWFGASLFVWTGLITVTLLSLAAGYYLGGRAADAGGSMARLGWLVAGAGGWLLFLPLVRVPVLKAAMGAGLRAGALLAALALFGPALTLLGMVTPFSVKLFLREVEQAGRTVGRLSALSTLGSFLGTVATGFWLIPAFHVDQITAGLAMALLMVAAILLGRAFRRSLPALLILPPLAFLPAPPLRRIILPSGATAEIVARQGSFCGQISVVDYRFGSTRTRDMLIDGIIQGGVDLADGRSIYPYPYAVEEAALASSPAAKKVLVIGLGPAILPNRLAAYGMSGTVVDIEPRIEDFARQHFGFRPGAFQVVLADGRTFIEGARERFDLVLLDAFSAENEPVHLMTSEAFRAIREILSPGGSLVINCQGLGPDPGAKNPALDSLLRTLGTAFPDVAAFYYPATWTPGSAIGYVLIGHLPGGPHDAVPPALLPAHPMAAPYLEGLFQHPYRPGPGAGSVYTDGWVPLEADGAPIKLLWRRATVDATPAEILLN